MLESAVFTFRIFSNGYQVNIFVRGINSFNRLAGTHISKQIKPFPQSNIQRSEAFSNRSLEWPLESIFVSLDCLYAFIGYQISLLSLALGMYLVRLKFNGDIDGSKDVLDTP